jgi:hypothetical protein
MLRSVTATIADNAVTPIANAAFNIHMCPLYALKHCEISCRQIECI